MTRRSSRRSDRLNLMLAIKELGARPSHAGLAKAAPARFDRVRAASHKSVRPLLNH